MDCSQLLAQDSGQYALGLGRVSILNFIVKYFDNLILLNYFLRQYK